MSGTPPPRGKEPPPNNAPPSQVPSYAVVGFAAPPPIEASGNYRGCQRDRAVAITDIVLTIIVSIGLFASHSPEGESKNRNRNVGVVSITLGIFEILSIAASICILVYRWKVWPLNFWMIVNGIRFGANFGALAFFFAAFSWLQGQSNLSKQGLATENNVKVPGPVLEFYRLVALGWTAGFIAWTFVYIALITLLCLHCHVVKRSGLLHAPITAMTFDPRNQVQLTLTQSVANVPSSSGQNNPA